MISIQEHHANLIPWQFACKRSSSKLVYAYLNEDLSFSNCTDVNQIKDAMASDITDLAGVRQVYQRVMVVLDGRVVENGPIEEVIGSPKHPYTQGLVAAARLSDVAPGERLPTVADYWQGAEE